MIKIIGILFSITLPMLSCGQNKSLSSLEKKYSDDKSFVLNLSGNFAIDPDDPELGELVNKFLSLKIIAVGKNAKHYSSRDVRRLKEEIKRQNLDEVMSVKSKGGNVKVFVKDRNGKLSKLFFIADDDNKGFVALDLTTGSDE